MKRVAKATMLKALVPSVAAMFGTGVAMAYPDIFNAFCQVS